MDEFDKKREMIQMLMDMLRKSAVDEVSPADKAVSMEKISVDPGAMGDLHPEAETHSDAVAPMPEEMADDMKEAPTDDMPEDGEGAAFEALLNRKRNLK